MTRNELLSRIEALRADTLRQCDAISACDQFVASATDEAAYGFGFAFFGRMRNAANAIPVAFEQLDPRSPVKGVDRRLQPYLRSQLFIALVAEVEVFVTQLLTAVLMAFPKKLKDRKLQLKDLLEAGDFEAVVAQSVQAEVWSCPRSVDG